MENKLDITTSIYADMQRLAAASNMTISDLAKLNGCASGYELQEKIRAKLESKETIMNHKSICHQCGSVFTQNLVRSSHKCRICGCGRFSFVCPREGETARDAACRTWDKIYADYRAYAGSDAEVLAIRTSQTSTGASRKLDKGD